MLEIGDRYYCTQCLFVVLSRLSLFNCAPLLLFKIFNVCLFSNDFLNIKKDLEKIETYVCIFISNWLSIYYVSYLESLLFFIL